MLWIIELFHICGPGVGEAEKVNLAGAGGPVYPVATAYKQVNQYTSFMHELQQCLLLSFSLLSIYRIWLMVPFCLQIICKMSLIAHSNWDWCREGDYGKHIFHILTKCKSTRLTIFYILFSFVSSSLSSLLLQLLIWVYWWWLSLQISP